MKDVWMILTRRPANSSCASFLMANVLVFVWALALTGNAEANEPHDLRQRGKTLIEAETFSAVSQSPAPRSEHNRKCSGQRSLAFYWKNNWFEIDINVPQLRNYRMSMQASSPTGTKIAVQMTVPQLDTVKEIPLATIEIPKTDDWTDYVATSEVVVPLPSGQHKLRFSNLEDGANVDYITLTAVDDDSVVTIRPTLNSGPDVNPLKGFKSGWWRETDDHASVGFQYIEWGQLEPKDDQFDWDYVESVLDRAGTKGRHFILQFVVDWDWFEPVDKNYLGPKWLLNKVGEQRGTADPKDPESRKMRVTNYNHPEFIAEAAEAIEALSKRFENDPRKFVLQAGLIGFWGEWHTFPREDWGPTDDTKRAILDCYLKNLERIGLTQLRYPDEPIAKPQEGMGYTNGSATLTEHGHAFGSAIAARKLWNNGPVSGEWPPNVEGELWKKFFSTDEGISFINHAGYSTLLPPESKDISEKIPGWKKDDRFMKMHRGLGYNFVAKEVRHIVDSTETATQIEVDLYNSGIAPFYQNWDVELAVVEKESGKVVDQVRTKMDLRKIKPGQKDTITGSLAAKLDPLVDYRMALRIVQPGATSNKEKAWPLNSRFVYVVLANDLDVIDGKWDGSSHALTGGWNLLGDIQRRKSLHVKTIDTDSFPMQGSFRPAKATR